MFNEIEARAFTSKTTQAKVNTQPIHSGLVSHPSEVDCHYTPIKVNLEKNGVQHFNGYNFYSSSGIESCDNTIACCLTAYNEPLSEYLTSLDSLAMCAEYFRNKGEERVSREMVICIIVDGLEKMSSEFAEWATQLGIFQPELLDNEASFHLFESQVPRSRLLRKESCLTKDEPCVRDSLQRVIVFAKSENRGKLDSHQCFFERICGLYSAKYFVQIDVGTSPNENALYYMWAELQDKPNVAATAARSLLPYPDSQFNLLEMWQYCDIAVERVINWPSEIFLGNLSVLPGQLSLTRIASIMETNDEAPSGSNNESLLDRYYRGLSELGPFEANMYLAEDRILGQEMVYQDRGKWELSYEINAEAVVDSCETWSELCRQRRRWICSSMACRVALLTKLPTLFDGKNRKTHERLHKLLATVYFLIYSFFEWSVPATHLIVQTTMLNLSLSLNKSFAFTMAMGSLGVLVLASIVLQGILAWRGKLSSTSDRINTLCLGLQSAFLVLNTIIVLLSWQFPMLALLLLIVPISYIGITAGYGRELAQRLSTNIVQYMFIRLPVKTYLMTYSIFNAHNTSWGTKGLSKSVHELGSVDVRKRYQRFRIFIIGLFLLTNLSLYGAALYSGMLNNVMTIYGVLTVLFIQLAIAFAAMISVKIISGKKRI